MMDYQEAIKEAETQNYMYESMILYNKDFEPKNDNSNYERKMDFLKTVISAMQELQEYRRLGTLEEMKLLKETHLTGAELAQISCMFKQLTEYEKIGTLEEIRKAVEKQNPKKVFIEDVGYAQYRNVNLYACICPSCGLHIIEFDDDDVCGSDSDNPAEMFHDCLVHHAYIGRNNYCDRCGQKLDWSEVEE